MKLVSWNVNGLRAVLRKNFLDFLAQETPDILCLQETKAGLDDVEQLWPATYTTYWNCAQKKGYSGTVIFARRRPLQVSCGIGRAAHDAEGRVLTAEYPDFFLVNVYVPNSQRELTVRFKNIKKNGQVKIDDKLFEAGELPSKDWEENYNDQTEEKPAAAPRP